MYFSKFEKLSKLIGISISYSFSVFYVLVVLQKNKNHVL